MGDNRAGARGSNISPSRSGSSRFSISEPTPYGVRRIARLRVEANLGMRSVFMHHVDQLLKEQEVAGHRAHTGPDEDAIKLLLRELATNNGLRRRTKISQTHLHAIAEARQFLL